MTKQLQELYRERTRILNAISSLHHMRGGERKDSFYSGYMNRLNKLQEQIDTIEADDRYPTIISGGEVLELGPQSSNISDDDLPF